MMGPQCEQNRPQVGHQLKAMNTRYSYDKLRDVTPLRDGAPRKCALVCQAC